MRKFLKQYLKSNDGDGYIMFLVLLVSFIGLASVVLSVLTIKITTNSIYMQVENSVDMAISDMKSDSYQQLIEGQTEGSVLPYHGNLEQKALANIAKLLSDNEVDADGNVIGYDVLKNDIENRYFEKYNNQGLLQYKIYDVDIKYNDNYDGQGFIELTFKLDIPVYFNNNVIFTSTNEFTKETQFNFKES